MEPKKSLQELTLLDRFLFDEAMEKPENKGNLPKRSRYYQAKIDAKLLAPGIVDFNKLNPMFFILIAPFDLFGRGRYRYTFTMRCKEEPDLDLNDGATRIFLNTHGTDEENISPELKELLDFMEHTNDEDPEFRSEKVRNLKRSVRAIQADEDVGVKYMQAWEERVWDRLEGKEEGIAEGIAEGMEKGMEKHLLQQVERKLEKGQSVEQIADALEETPERIRELMDKVTAFPQGRRGEK